MEHSGTHFTTAKEAALVLLGSGHPFTVNQAQFLGTVVVTSNPLSEAQRSWLDGLIERGGFPPLYE